MSINIVRLLKGSWVNRWASHSIAFFMQPAILDMKVGSVQTTTDIMNMRVAKYFGGTSAIVERTRRRLSLPASAGTNTVLVAHGNVLVTATDVYPQEAEAIVFRPDGLGSYAFVARVLP